VISSQKLHESKRVIGSSYSESLNWFGVQRRPVVWTSAHAFKIVALTIVICSAFLAGSTPFWFTVAIVVLFGGPHNYSELRYALSRFPSRFGPLRPFFITSFAGVALLYLTEVALVLVTNTNTISTAQAWILLLTWNELFIAWILALSILRYCKHDRQSVITNCAIALIGSWANILSPQMFTIAMTYLHPMLGLWLFERELRRTKKSWLSAYHRCLQAVPLAVAGLIWWHAGTMTDAMSMKAIQTGLGTQLFAGPSPVMLLAVYGFLQMMHYAVWVLGMPIATNSWTRWRLEQTALLRDRSELRSFALYAVGCISIGVPLLWLGYRLNYAFTNDLYMVLAMLHVIAELPLIFWMCES